MNSSTQHGVVKFYKDDKGFGFIVSETGEEIFVHISGLAPGTTLEKGDAVSFETVNGKKGINAVNVQPVN
jgi:cold shock protein